MERHGATTVHHALHNPTLGKTSPSSFISFTTMPPTDHHKHNRPSQAPLVVTFMHFLLQNLRVHLYIDFLQINGNLHKNKYTKAFGHTINLKKSIKNTMKPWYIRHPPNLHQCKRQEWRKKRDKGEVHDPKYP